MAMTDDEKRARKTEYQRKWRAKNRTAPPRQPAAHGTDSGYKAHRRKGEDACDACKRAHADAWNEYARKSGAPNPYAYGRSKKLADSSG